MIAGIWAAASLFFKGLPDGVKRFLAGIVLLLGLALLVWFGVKQFDKVLTNRYNEGVAAGIEQHKNQVAENNKVAVDNVKAEMKELTKGVEASLAKLQSGQAAANAKTDKVLSTLKTQQVTVMKDGKCVPAKEFIESWNAIIQSNAVR